MVEQKLKPLLIVEDEDILRESLQDWLTEGGYQAEVAKDGEQALEIIDKHDFSLMLLDLRLPGKNGIEVLREARAKRPQLKVIIITAYPSVETAVQAMKEGAVDYLPKPMDLDELEKIIRGTLMPKEVKAGQKAASDAIAQVAVVKDAQGINLTLTGWEYIDAYLNGERKMEEKD